MKPVQVKICPGLTEGLETLMLPLAFCSSYMDMHALPVGHIWHTEKEEIQRKRDGTVTKGCGRSSKGSGDQCALGPMMSEVSQEEPTCPCPRQSLSDYTEDAQQGTILFSQHLSSAGLLIPAIDHSSVWSF